MFSFPTPQKSRTSGVDITRYGTLPTLALTMPAFVAGLFAHRTRTTCIAIAHNLTCAVFGRLSLMICTWVANATGSRFVPAWYVTVPVVVALTCIFYFRLRYQPAPSAMR